MISHRGISVITPLPSGEGKGEGPLPHRGISVITPLPFGGGAGGGAAIFLTPVCFVLLCKSVRKNTPRHSYKTSNKGQCEAYIHSIGVSR